MNVALLVDVLRGIKELGLKPKRTIRVVAFNAEELGMWGSAEYVSAAREGARQRRGRRDLRRRLGPDDAAST